MGTLKVAVLVATNFVSMEETGMLRALAHHKKEQKISSKLSKLFYNHGDYAKPYTKTR